MIRDSELEVKIYKHNIFLWIAAIIFVCGILWSILNLYSFLKFNRWMKQKREYYSILTEKLKQLKYKEFLLHNKILELSHKELDIKSMVEKAGLKLIDSGFSSQEVMAGFFAEKYILNIKCDNVNKLFSFLNKIADLAGWGISEIDINVSFGELNVFIVLEHIKKEL